MKPKTAIIGYKKVHVLLRGEPHDVSTSRRAIVTLKIPASASVVTVRGEGGKHRASKAKVLSIQLLELYTNESSKQSTTGMRFVAKWGRRGGSRPFFYRKGETVTPRSAFNRDKTSQCESGIHFFKRRQLAVNHGI